MTVDSVRSQTARFGFITVIQVPELGHCGGLLILNKSGRPTEFHCTAPVPDNRAQRILYGPTYESFLYCDQIGLALVGKSRQRPDLLLTNNERLLHLSDLVDSPVLLVESQAAEINLGSQSSKLDYFEIHDQLICTPKRSDASIDGIRQLCISFSDSIPIDEPFERIAQAIEEAQAVVR